MASLLEGIRVLDLTVAAVGPWATKLLGALGADVIKVEAPGGDLLSHMVPPKLRGGSVLYISANHNKRMIELDLKKEADRAIALKIVQRSDVFVQNMRPGAVERLGLGYDVVAQANPRIVYVAASAYGRTGPMATEAGIDPTVQAVCGWCSITGPADGTSGQAQRGLTGEAAERVQQKGEMFRHLAHLDLTTATVITQAVLQGLLARERTGKGQKIEVEMLTAAIALQTTRIAEYLASGVQPAPLGSAAATTAPHQAFACQDKKYIAVGVTDDEQWTGLCRALGLESIINDTRFETNPARVANRDALSAILADKFAAKPAAWWLMRLSAENVPSGPFLTFDQLKYHPQVIDNQYIVEIDSPHWGHMYVDGLPWKFSRTPAGPIRAGGMTGEHTAEVLAELGITSGGAERSRAHQSSEAKRASESANCVQNREPANCVQASDAPHE
ncbi:MAG: CaiB/BaiF CoA transferase family protein [Candidatus Binataceae bacterium]